MQQRLSKMLTHLAAYRRLLAVESERLKSVNLMDRRERRAILRHLRTVRLSARDLEDMLKREGDGRGAQPEAEVAAE
jgi:hypothetical protein